VGSVAVLKAIDGFSVDGATPLDALVAIAAWKQQLKGG
jgi:hypothetical protein